MKIALIGNCQITGVRQFLASAAGSIQVTSLPAVHTLTAANKPMLEKALSEADWIFTQPIQNSFHIEYVRTQNIKDMYASKTIVWPVVYFPGYAPEWNILKDDQMLNYRGPLIDYHSSKIIFGFLRGLSNTETCKMMRLPSDFDDRNYSNSVLSSLQELIRREEEADVKISDFILEHFRRQRLFHVMNHPALVVLEVIATRLLKIIGIKDVPAPQWMFSDVELVQSWHPENTYIREKEVFTFPSVHFYRGTNIMKDDSKLGFSTAGIKVYDHQAIVDAFFRLYTPHQQLLERHPRVEKLMAANR